MTDPISRAMQAATRLTGSGRLAEATGLIRRTLSKLPETLPLRPSGRLSGRPSQPARPGASAAPVAGGDFTSGTFANPAGSRPFKLYVPRRTRSGTLIVMLHGCTQSPDDFATGTRMNAAAEERGHVVLYPGQTQNANAQRCWNWFQAEDQARGRGEPSLIADMTRQVIRDQAIDPSRVFVAGLSAGGAAAANLAATYPDLYAAIGVHSGLACGAARDLPSAMAAMRQGRGGPALARPVPAIVFHGDRDATVHPDNADAVVAQLAAGMKLARRTEAGRVPDGHAYSRTLLSDPEGFVLLEHWTIHGAGHAWSGGSTAGSHTDPAGPDASRAMLDFFGSHPR